MIRESAQIFDRAGRLTRLVQADPVSGIALDAGGAPVASAPVTEYQYDALGRLTRQTSPVPSATNTVRPVAEFRYDAHGRRISVIQPNATDGAPTGPTTSFEYDAVGNLTRETSPDPDGNPASGQPAAVATYGYDNLNRPKERRLQAAGVVGEHNVEFYSYDLAGNRTQVQDLSGYATYHTFDPLGRLTSTLDQREGLTRYQYDAVGNLTSLLDPALNVTRFAYGPDNQKTRETNPQGFFRVFAYDSLGQLTGVTDRGGRYRSFAYDHLGRRTKEYWDGSASPSRTLSFTYDAAGQLVGAADPSAVYGYAFDKLGRAATVTSTLAGLSSAVAAMQTFDALGRRTNLSVGVGAAHDLVNSYQYDALSRMKQGALDRTAACTPPARLPWRRQSLRPPSSVGPTPSSTVA